MCLHTAPCCKHSVCRQQHSAFFYFPILPLMIKKDLWPLLMFVRTDRSAGGFNQRPLIILAFQTARRTLAADFSAHAAGWDLDAVGAELGQRGLLLATDRATNSLACISTSARLQWPTRRVGVPAASRCSAPAFALDEDVITCRCPWSCI